MELKTRLTLKKTAIVLERIALVLFATDRHHNPWLFAPLGVKFFADESCSKQNR